MEPRFRRVQQGASAGGRGLPGMPVEMEDPDEETAPRKPRFTAPRKPWWRPAGPWGRAFLAAGALVVAVALGTAWHFAKSFLEHDARFRIAGTSNIEATGLAEVSRNEILPVFGEDIGRNIFFVPLAERRRQLEQIPWVERATVMRLLPDRIRVTVVERQPVAFVRQGQQIGLVDASGVLLNMPMEMIAQHHYSFPVLTGIDPGDTAAARKARIGLYLRMMGELDGGGQHLSDQISEIDLTDPEDARVLMPEQGSDILAHFGEDHFLDRYQRYKAHIAEWRQQYPQLAGVDLRYDQQVVLQMTSGTENAQVATAPGAASAPAAQSMADAAPKPDAAKPAPVHESAKADAAKAAKPEPHESAKAEAAKPGKTAARAVKSEHAQAKTEPGARKVAASHAAQKSAIRKSGGKTAVARSQKPESAKTRQQRVDVLAAKMRARHAAEVKRTALETKKKTAAKTHAGQGQ